MSRSRYRIVYIPKVKEKLKKLPKNISYRILKAIEQRLKIMPEEMGKQLLKEWRYHRRLRVGDYRVIYRVYDDEILVLIVEIDHRKSVYEN